MIKNDFPWLVNEIPRPTRLPVFRRSTDVTRPISGKAMGRLSTAAPNTWI